MPVGLPAIQEAITSAVEDVAQDVIDYIEATINKYIPGTTGEFSKAWSDPATVAAVGNYVSAVIDYNAGRLSSDPDNFVHGSVSWGDARDFLPDLLNAGNVGMIFGEGWWRHRPAFWDNITADLESLIPDWFESAMRSRGL